jgi:hypothetical protein
MGCRALVLLACVAGCGNDNTVMDMGVADQAVDDLTVGNQDLLPTSVSYQGIAVAATGSAPTRLAGAMVTFQELPSVSATSDSMGTFSMKVPTETPLTLMMTATGYPTTIARTVVLHGKFPTGLTIVTVALPQADFDLLNANAGVAAGSGIVGVVVVSQSPCNSDGSGVTLSASSGQVEYVSSGVLPPDGGGSSTGSTGATAFNAYILGATGTVTPSIATAAPSCTAATPPVNPQSFFTVPTSAVTVMPGALSTTTVFQH